MIKFSILFERFMIRERISIPELPKKVGLTEGYWRNVESGRRPPPTFVYCEKLVELFNLNAQEKNDFYRAAFIGRIKKSDLPFWEMIQVSTSTITSKQMRDPLVTMCAEIANNHPASAKDNIKQLLESFITLPAEKRQAILQLCKK